MGIGESVLAFFLSAFLLAPHHNWAPNPTSAHCPQGDYLGEGVRTSGEFACYHHTKPWTCCGEPKGPCSLTDCPEPEITRSQIHCTAGSIPVIVDQRTIACQRGRHGP